MIKQKMPKKYGGNYTKNNFLLASLKEIKEAGEIPYRLQ